ncbi:endonuclease V [Halomarina oriensis]|uniref:Endonuclease V n=2 Tax=Halomarina oriensis TaxID=671145 RepID=A0A6B0GNT6_9EURY|nr:endonuclease V [Halomarina oriensis]MWG35247.1 endonuclease V [Halomarina oriensis]
MEALQRDIATTARFEDAFDVDLAALDRADFAPDDQTTLDGPGGDPPLVAGVDQAFLDERVVSAIVVLRGAEVVERTHAVSPLTFPYVPGLLSFREGGPILDAFETLDADPDVALFDGSGRIHFRQAGLATHMGLALDVPALGVAKRLLCGTPVADTDRLDAGDSVAIESDDRMDAPPGTVVGHAVQTRQFDSYRINPVYVSPGHRVSAATARDVVLACRGGYKLPEPTRVADAYADEVKADYS